MKHVSQGTAGDGGARRPLLRIVGHFGWRTGRDGQKSSVLILPQDGRIVPLGTLRKPMGFSHNAI